MSSSSKDPQSPPDEDLSWLNGPADGADAAATRDVTADVTAPADTTTAEATQLPEPPNPAGSPAAVRVPFAKKSLPPPPAGRGPLNMTTAGIGPKLDAPAATTAAVPELPPDVSTQGDPVADLFDGSAQPVMVDTPAVDAADKPEEPPAAARPSASVAKLGLAKTLIGGPAHEIMALEGKRDPRADPESDPPAMPSPLPVGLTGVVFDPDQSVAQRLGEASLDASIGASSGSGISDQLPDLGHDSVLDEERAAPTPPRPRSMRSAMMIIGLVLISGAAATAFSLGVIGGPPSRLRTPVAANPPATAPIAAASPPAPVAAAPVVAPAVVAPAVVEPAVVAPAVVEPAVVEPATPEVTPEPPPPEPAPVAPVAAEPAAPPPVVAPAVTSGDPVAAGDARLRAGDLDGALTQYRAGLAADADDHHAMEGMARVHLARGEAALALPYAKAIVKRRPKRGSYRALLDEVTRAAR